MVETDHKPLLAIVKKALMTASKHLPVEASASVLRYYEVTKPVIVQCNTSQKGMGTCILQEGQPVEYSSRALTETEQFWPQFKKELYSLLFAMEKFHSYVYGWRHVTVETDHKPLLFLSFFPVLMQ